MRRKVWLFFISVVGTMVGYFGALVLGVHYQLPLLKNAEVWLKDVYAMKDRLNSEPTELRRVLIFGGSNVLFGFNGAMIEANANVRFINYGTHAGLPINYQVDKILRTARSGDIVFYSPVFSAFFATEPYEDYWYIQNMMSWDKEYGKFITKKHRALAYLYNDPMRIFQNLAKILVRSLLKAKEPATPKANAAPTKAWSKDGLQILPCAQEFYGYSYKSLSPNGDFCSQYTTSSFAPNEHYIYDGAKVSTFFIQEFGRLRDFAKAHGITLLLLYPVSMENPLFSLHDRRTHAKITQLESSLKAQGIYFANSWEDAHFERKYFYDTGYHLNKHGVELHTIAFIKLLRSLKLDR